MDGCNELECGVYIEDNITFIGTFDPNPNPSKIDFPITRAENCAANSNFPHGQIWTSCIKFTMSLYHEAAAILDTVNKGKTSLKAEIFGKKTWKTDGKVLFALTSEAAKWSSILAEVVEKSGLLKIEKQVSV